MADNLQTTIPHRQVVDTLRAEALGFRRSKQPQRQ